MTDVPTTDDVRDIWVDYHLNPLPRAEGVMLVPEYQAAFDAWLETIRADEREQWEYRHAALTARLLSVWTDLREKVEALPVTAIGRPGTGQVRYLRRAEVLALFDGGSE